MSDSALDTASPETEQPSKSDELRVFLRLTVILAPVLSVIIVGGYGFLVWMSHLLFGPPGS